MKAKILISIITVLILTNCNLEKPKTEDLEGLLNIPDNTNLKVGDKTKYNLGDNNIDFKMVYVNGGITFPIFPDDSSEATVEKGYEIAESEVNYKLWKTVYDWATDSNRGTKMYYFKNVGVQGKNGNQYTNERHAVTTISWRDTIVWLNALTEYYNEINGTNLKPVYIYNNQVIRDSRDANGEACDNLELETNSKGFRLLTNFEWELAARYNFNYNSNTVYGYRGNFFTKGNSASGAMADYENEVETSKVAWYCNNACASSKETKTRRPNELGLYDMSGNVNEFTFSQRENYRKSAVRGGAWKGIVSVIQIGYWSSTMYEGSSNLVGFRFGRSNY